MPVRLNITIDEDVHERLKRELPAKGISRFINDAIRAILPISGGARPGVQNSSSGAMAEGRSTRVGHHGV
jgi:hypothetical protein